MCRSTTPNESRDRSDRIRIRSFYLRLAGAGAGACSRCALPETLTLVYLPRIDGSLLEVNGSKVPAEATAIVPLHHVRSQAEEALYASADRVRAGEGARFEVYFGEEKAVRGAFRRREGGGWGVECRSAAEGKAVRAAEAAEVWVAEEGAAGVMRGRVDFAAEGRRRRRRRREGFCLKLEEIPEESDGCDCLCCEGGEEEEAMDSSDGEDSKEMDGVDEELEMEGVKWAVDVGLWVMCLGVGLLVSRASSKSLRSKFF